MPAELAEQDLPGTLTPSMQLATTEQVRLPAWNDHFDLFHSNHFSGHGYASALGANAEGTQWISHFGQFDYLPTGATPDAELVCAWQDMDEAAWKRRTKQLCGPDYNAESVAKGQAYQWIRMRKGDVVMAHKADEFVLGVFEHEPLEMHAIFWSSLSELSVDPSCTADLHARRAFRRVSWRRVGLQSDLNTGTQQYLKGFRSSTAMRARDPDKRRVVYADLLRCSQPIIEQAPSLLPPAAVEVPSPLSAPLIEALPPFEAPPPEAPPPDALLPAIARSSAEHEQELAMMVVIGDLVEAEAGLAMPIGQLVNGAAENAGVDVTVELSDVGASAAIKVDPDDNPDDTAAAQGVIRQGHVARHPRALAVQPVLEAMGSVQAPRRRAREVPDAVAQQAEQPRSSRPRRDAPPAASFLRGQRVSCLFDHNGAATVFHGAVTRVHTEFRSCDVEFDDGRSHRVAMSRLTFL